MTHSMRLRIPALNK
ncbi:erythromycin resistance leader peptide [Robertmurraya sp. DFI.2.37]